jgi:hypothetical protein
MTYEDDLREVERAWEAAFGEYAARRDAALGRVARWEWARGDRHDPRPLHYLLHPGRARLLKQPPEDYRLQPVEYGFDDQDRVVVKRQYHALYPPFELFARHTPERIEQITYSAVTGTPIPGQAEHFAINADGTISRYASFRLNGYGPGPAFRGRLDPDSLRALFGPTGGVGRTHDTYHYREGRVERITNLRVSHNLSLAHTEYRVEYDAQGRVERIVRSGEREEVAYQRRKSGESLSALLKAANAALHSAIPEAMRRAAFPEPLYCLVLNFRSVTQYYPPYLLPGFARERDRQLAAGDLSQVWRPLPTSRQAWPLYPINDSSALEACARAEHAINTAEAWDQAERSLRALARDLHRLDWSALMPVTPDFVVYALNYEDDAMPALRASASAAQLRSWRQRGLLG